MAIYHASIKTFSRSQGHTATAAAAYRAGCRVRDERTGLVHDYRRRAGVASVSVHVPDDAPAGSRDLATLWNRAEAAEVRSNARVARELEVALPAELSDAGRQAIADELARHLVERYRVAVLAAVHRPDAGGDPRNHHVHLLFSTRVLGPGGFGDKVRILDDRITGPQEVRALRHAVADCINRHLEAAQRPERVDARSLEAQAQAAAERGDVAAVAILGRTPTRHLGKAAAAARRAGRHSPRADRNAAIRRDNTAARAYALRWDRENPAIPIPIDLVAPGQGGQADGRRRVDRPPEGRPRVARTVARGRMVPGLKASLDGFRAGTAEMSEATRRYLEGLADTVRRNADSFIQAQHTEASMTQQAEIDREWSASGARLRNARAAARAAEEASALAGIERRRAMMRTLDARLALEALDAGKPSAVRVLSRRVWAKKRREQARAAERAWGDEQKTHARVFDLQITVENTQANVQAAHAARAALRERANSPGPTPCRTLADAPAPREADVQKPRSEATKFTARPAKRPASP